MDPNRELNRQLTGFCMRYLGRPSFYFTEQGGIPEVCWHGPGFYLLKLEGDEVGLLGYDFDDAWKEAQLLKVEAEVGGKELERKIALEKRRQRRAELLESTEAGLIYARRLLGASDGLLDEGVKRLRGLAEGAALLRELVRPDEGDQG